MSGIENLLPALLTALGLGLLIGTVRERQQADTLAGVRTHALTAMLGAIALQMGTPEFLIMLGLVAGLVLIGYWRSSVEDRGLTGEIALLLTALLGGLALTHATLAAALGVIAAALLYAKASLHRFTRELLSEREVHDGLVLLAAALIILPLIPNHPVGPFASFNPSTLWRLVVLVMAISALGHISLRVIGNRWGLAIAGFFAGYVSSTAAIAGFGQRVREKPEILRSAVAAAMFANLASLSLIVPVLLTVAPELLPVLAAQLLAAGVVLLIGGLLGLRGGTSGRIAPPTSESRMFRIGQVLTFAVAITAVLFISAALNAWLGPHGALIAPLFAALAELHAAIASVGQLFHQHVLDAEQARWALLGVLAMSVLAKTIVAGVSGGRAYALRVAVGLIAALLATLAAMLFPPWIA
jgi:uncharacterized membrane protein (DUF4010 family)